jgi:hypothetical protein
VKRLFRFALAGVALFAAGFAYDRFWRAPDEEELEKLRQQRRILSARLEERLARELHGLEARDATVIVGVPERFVERFAGELATRLFSDVRLTFAGIKIRKEGELRGRIIVGRSELGKFALDVDLDEVQAVLRAGKPNLTFDGAEVRVVLPVALVEGTGRGRLRFRWDARGVATAVCGDLELAGGVAGRVVPDSYTLRGAFRLAMDGPRLVARPTLEEIGLHLRIEPSAETWELVDKAIAAQGAVCRTALRAADVAGRVRALVDRGFDVKLPRKALPEARLPLDLEQPVDVEGQDLRVQVTPRGLTVAPARLWYGADVSVAAR